MSIEKGKEYLKKYGLDSKVLEFDVSSATVTLAAKALNVIEGRIAKTLSFKDKEGKAFLVVCAGDVKIDNAKFKGFFHTKATMLSHEEAAILVGHAVGGVCPFGVNDGVVVYCDDSLKKYDTVYPAVGSSNSAIELTPLKLFDICGANCWVDVTKQVID